MKGMKKINKTVWELLAGIILCGAVLLLAGILLAPDKLSYTAGLGIGLLVAVFMTFHMYVSIEKAIDAGEGSARTTVISSYAVRTLVMIGSILLVGLFEAGNLIAMVLGIMTLKVAAYLQPITHKFIEGVKPPAD